MATEVESGTWIAAAEEIPEVTGQTRSAATLLVCALFVLSGACGLAYEVVWSKYLGLFLGNTVLLHTAVLGTFMGGLALGSLLVGRKANRAAMPLKAYGWLEIGIAGYALAFPTLATAAQHLVGLAAAALPPGSTALLVTRVLTAAGLLVLPTLLMGATFPLLTAHVERHGIGGPNGANWLYFANCGGAVLGTLLTGFGLIPQLGLSGTVLGVAIVNLVVGSIALVAGGATAGTQPRLTSAERLITDAAAEHAGPAPEKTILLAIGLSGATAFFYELVWTRLFAVSLGSSTYSFTLMLAAFISGLAGGSAAANLRPIRRAPLAWLAAAEIGIALAIALSVPLYPRLPYWFWQWKWLLRPTEASLGLFHTLQYGLIFLVMAVPTFLFGLTFPAAIRAIDAGHMRGGTASRAAAVYGWNTVGTLVGVLAAGWLLIPTIGLQRTLQAGALLNLVTAGIVLAGMRPRRGMPSVVGRIALTLLLLALTPAWPTGILTFGVFRRTDPPPATWADYRDRVLSRPTAYYREEFGTTVAVVRTQDPHLQVPQLCLVVDGKPDATSVGDMPTQVLLGQIPLFLKPDSQDVFILGLGSGVTAGSVLTHPVRSVACVELSSAVADAAPLFAPANGGALQDPRFRLTIDDGRTFLANARGRYDVVISEPTNPWIAGVGTLFSEESFRTAARALKPGGIAAQWFHTYSLDDALVATIIRTFRKVFPYAVIFEGGSHDYILVGSQQPLSANFRQMEARLARPTVARDLARIRIERLAALLAKQTHSRAATAALAAGGGINSDDMPLLEYRAPRALYTAAEATKIVETDGRLQRGSGLLIEAYLGERGPRREDSRSLLNVLAEPRMANPILLESTCRRHLRQWPEDTEALRLMTRLMAQRQRWDEANAYAERAAALGDGEARMMGKDLRRRIAAEEVSVFSAPK